MVENPEHGEIKPGRGIEALELNEEHTSHGTWPNEQGERVPVNFKYGSVSTSVRELVNNPEVIGGRGREIGRNFEPLGVDDIGLTVYTRRNHLAQQSKEPLNEPAHVYVLLHGWTANRGIYDKAKMENELSVIEAIMAEDPNAVIITMDGNGFGETTFRQDVLNDKELLAEKCHPTGYANQVDFLVKDILGMDPTEVTVAGHSMGGAATMELSTRGYGNCVALAPAAFPTTELRNLVKKVQAEDADKLEDALQRLTAKQRTEFSKVIYKALGYSVELGANIGKLGGVMEHLSDKTVSWIFDQIGPYLMGRELGDGLLAALGAIHGEELSPDKLKTVSTAILRLSDGMNFESFSSSQNLTIVHSTKDVLVQPNDIEGTAAHLVVKQLYNAAWDEDAASVQGSLRAWSDVHTQDLTIDGGHYASVYNENILKLIVARRPVIKR